MNNSKNWWFNIRFLGINSGLFFLFSLVALWGVWKITDNFVTGISQIFRHEVTSPTINNPHLIVKQIQAISELTTSVFVMDAIIPTSSRRKIGNWVVGETNLLYIGRGEVEAGLDLSEMKPDNIVIDSDKIKIKLPPVKILDQKIDVNQSQVYDYDRGFLNLGPDVAPQLQAVAQKETLIKIKKSACEHKILDQASEKAVMLITDLMENAGFSQVEVITTPSQDCL